MTKFEENFLKKHGWTVECESPLEIKHEDGSIATGQAVQMIINYLFISI